jgi:hypothetical protein
MAAKDELDTRSKLRCSKKPPPGFRTDQNGDIALAPLVPDTSFLERETSPIGVIDNVWEDQYDEHIHALGVLELRLAKQKRKVYEIQRVLQQNIEAASVLLSLLHSAIEEF